MPEPEQLDCLAQETFMSRIQSDLVAHCVGPGSNAPLSEMLAHPLRAAKVPRVAIIGAGFSGLRCADILIRAGVQVTILEARDRVGGRVHQVLNDKYLVDMGPNWIHGTADNPVQKLAESTNTVTIDPGENQLIFDSKGTKKSEKVSRMLSAEVWGTILHAFKYSNDHHDQIDPELSLMDYFRREIPKRFSNDPQMVQDILQEATMWGFFVGGDTERQSLRCFFLEEGLDGENTFVASSYKSILAEVGNTAMKGAEVNFNKEVTMIEYRTSKADSDSVILTTKDGEKSVFDEVVVTCPLGWLKRNKSAFAPALPVRLSQAIDNIGYGCLEKLYVTFPSAFWLGHSSNNTSLISGDSGVQLEQNVTTPIFMHFQSPTYHPIPESKQSRTWNVTIMSLAHLPFDLAHPTLLFYLYGDCGTELTSKTAASVPHSDEYNDVLLAFALPFIRRIPNYSLENQECVPRSFLLTSWQTDPFSGFGSYSNYQVGLEEGHVDIETMRNAGGLSDEGRGVWFAGEHTAPFIASGTTTGAYWSGEAVGRRIAKAYSLDVKAE